MESGRWLADAPPTPSQVTRSPDLAGSLASSSGAQVRPCAAPLPSSHPPSLSLSLSRNHAHVHTHAITPRRAAAAGMPDETTPGRAYPCATPPHAHARNPQPRIQRPSLTLAATPPTATPPRRPPVDRPHPRFPVNRLIASPPTTCAQEDVDLPPWLQLKRQRSNPSPINHGVHGPDPERDDGSQEATRHVSLAPSRPPEIVDLLTPEPTNSQVRSVRRAASHMHRP